MLHIRPAIVEDNDDLLPILEQCSPEGLAERYGTIHIHVHVHDDTHVQLMSWVYRHVFFYFIQVNISLLN